MRRSTACILGALSAVCVLAALPVRCALDADVLATTLWGALNTRLERQVKYTDVQAVLRESGAYNDFQGVDVVGQAAVGAVAAKIAALVEGKEAALRKLVASLENSWEEAFTGGNLEESRKCNVFVDREGTPPPDLKVVPNYGQPMDMGTSSVTWAPEVDKEEDSVQLAACLSAQLDAAFKENSMVDPSIKFQHFGAAAGFWRAFPGHKCVPPCSPYDPRKRPWYASAASGPKSVILILDTSGSMSTRNRMQLMKDAAKAVLSTLTHDDFFNVVTFSSNAEPLMECNTQVQSGLVRASALYKARATAAIDALSPSGNTNYEAGFQLAFDMITTGREFDKQAQCRTAILFLTDGDRTAGEDPNAVASERNSNDIDVHIFTYALGKEATDTGELEQLACDHKGSYTEIDDGGDLVTKMASFFQILAVGIDSETIVWTQPYYDATGLITDSNGLMVTLSLPVYDHQTHKNFDGLIGRDYRVLLGVMGLDVMMSEMTALVKPLTGLRSYGFMVSRAGATFAHPRLRPQSLDGEPDTLFLDIAQVDTSKPADEAEFVKVVRPGLVSGATGSARLQIDRYISRGSGSSVEKLPVTTTTYFWAPASGRFSVGFALDPSDEKLFQLKERPNPNFVSYYHRLRQYPSSTIANANISVSSISGQDFADNMTTYFLAHRAYTNPYAASQLEETSSFVSHMHKFMNDQSNTVQNNFLFDGGGVRNGVRPTVQLGSQRIEPLWDATAPDSDLMFRCWSTLDTGYISCYPGIANLDSDYDPVVRPWFERALAFRDKYAVTTPFINVWAAPTLPLKERVIVSIYRTLFAASSIDGVLGVVGMDYSYTAFQNLIESTGNCSLSDCAGKTCCLLIDSGGFIISDPSMDLDGTGVWAETQVHMRDGPSHTQQIWDVMDNDGTIVETDSYNDYGAKQMCDADRVKISTNTLLSVNLCVGTTRTVNIAPLGPITNVFVLAIEDWPTSISSSCNQPMNTLGTPTATCRAIEFDACSPPPDYPRFDLKPCSDFEASVELLDLIRSDAGSARCGLWWWEWLLIAVFAIWLPVFGILTAVSSFYFGAVYFDKFGSNPSKWMRCFVAVACCVPGLGCLALGIAFCVCRFVSKPDPDVEGATKRDDETRIEMAKGRENRSASSKSKTTPTKRNSEKHVETAKGRATRSAPSKSKTTASKRKSEKDVELANVKADSSTLSSSSSLSMLADNPRSATSDLSSESDSDFSSDEGLCMICEKVPPGLLLAPCGHPGVCARCAKTASKCPVCHKPVTGVLKPF